LAGIDLNITSSRHLFVSLYYSPRQRLRIPRPWPSQVSNSTARVLSFSKFPFSIPPYLPPGARSILSSIQPLPPNPKSDINFSAHQPAPTAPPGTNTWTSESSEKALSPPTPNLRQLQPSSAHRLSIILPLLTSIQISPAAVTYIFKLLDCAIQGPA
jgi:hypothetical protein